VCPIELKILTNKNFVQITHSLTHPRKLTVTMRAVSPPVERERPISQTGTWLLFLITSPGSLLVYFSLHTSSMNRFLLEILVPFVLMPCALVSLLFSVIFILRKIWCLSRK
jgi:hypothetical protein